MWIRMKWLGGKRNKIGIAIILSTEASCDPPLFLTASTNHTKLISSFCAMHDSVLERASKMIIDVLSITLLFCMNPMIINKTLSS